jgi:hypothetical protein
MRERIILLGVLMSFVASLHLGCAIPRMVWPQKNIALRESADPSMDTQVLVASRSSDFKDAVVERIRQAFENEPVYIKFIGLDDLKHEDGSRYKAIVLINVCIAWGLDPKVEGFLEDREDHSNIIVLTTSGDGDWLPDLKGRNFDAISSASRMADVNAVAGEIIAKIFALLGEE